MRPTFGESGGGSVAGPFDAHQGAAQETESRFPHSPEDPPPDFRNKLMWIAVGAIALGALWLVATWILR